MKGLPIILCLLLSSCTFQVMPDKSSVRAQQRIADALEHYLENHDARTISSPGETQAKVSSFSEVKWWPKSALLGVKYVRQSVLGDGTVHTAWVEYKLESGVWQIRLHTKAPKDTLNNTLYED